MVIYCCPDLIFATKIRATADALGVITRPARDAQALQNRLEQVPDGRANDPVTGVMIDLDLGDDALAFIQQVKRHDAAIPVIAYGSHVLVEQLAAAREAGANDVLTRGRFTAELPRLLQTMGSSTV